MKRILASLLFLLLVSCKTIRVGELRKEFAGPGYARFVSAEHHEIEIRYIPMLKRLLESQGLEDEFTLSPRILDSLKQTNHPKGIHLAMTIRPKVDTGHNQASCDLVFGSASGFTNPLNALEAFRFGFKEKVWVETDGRKIPAMNYHMENFFGMTAGRTFHLSFPDIEPVVSSGSISFSLVLDDLVPGLSRQRIRWDLPVGKYDEKI